MKKWLFKLGSLPLLLLLLSMEMPAGIRYENRKESGPLSIHILEVDPKKVSLEVAHASPFILSLEKVSEIAKRKGAFAAINGGFFRMQGEYAGSSAGILKIAGAWLSSPRLERAAVGWKRKNCRPLIDRVTWESALKCKESSLALDGINQPAADDKVILYTSGFFPTSVSEKNSADLQLDSSFRVLALYKNGNTPIPEKGYVLNFGKQRSHLLSPPDPKKIDLSLRVVPLHHPENAQKWNEFDDIVGGTPLLVDNGVMITDYSIEKTRIPFLEERHSRTAMGIKANGNLLFVVVDGRQPNLSIGVTMRELAQWMFDLGAVSALNLDGGGSSTMVVEGRVVNIPARGEDDDKPQGDERLVSDAILIFTKG